MFWPLGLLGLAFPLVLLANVVFIVLWIMFRKWWFIAISVAAILLSWKFVSVTLAWNYWGKNEMFRNESSIKVLGWNVEHFDISNYKKDKSVKERMVSLIQTEEPDILCFQEFVCDDRHKRKALFQLDSFEKAFGTPYSFYAYDKSLDFDAYHHFGIVIFSRYPIINKYFHQGVERNYNSIYQYADIVVRQDTFRIINIHLQSTKFSNDEHAFAYRPDFDNRDTALMKSKSIIKKLKHAYQLRSSQADQVKKAVLGSPYPVILCGDFNDIPTSYAYFTVKQQLSDAFLAKGWGFGQTFKKIFPTLRIDQVFYDPSMLKAVGYRKYRTPLVDHYPQFANFVVKKQGKLP